MEHSAQESPFPHNPDGAGNRTGELAAALCVIEGELRALIGSTEEEFLGIGARLHDFHAQAGVITAMAEQVVELVGGGDVAGGVASLERIVERMRFYLGKAVQESELGVATLSGISERLDEVDAPLSGFRKINKVLRMLGISTRIESTRLVVGAEGFDTLANDVQELYVQINEKAAAIHERKREFHGTTRQALERVRAMGREQRANAGTMLDRAETSLSVLGDIMGGCSGTAAQISAASNEVSANIASIVTSMQFHDITRQQMEHVAEALAELCARLDAAGAGADGGDDWRRAVVDTGSVCELQIAQLDHALGELTGAVTNIMHGLQGVAGEGGTISMAARDMAGAADRAGSSFFAEMDSSLAGVAAVLDKSAAENRSLAVVLEAMAGTVAEIAAFVDGIETIGEEIELIAINAQVKAARTGDEGAALGVLAEAIQKLAVDARGQTGVISGMLRNITDASGGLSGEVDRETCALEVEVREMAGGLGELIRMLGRVNADFLGLLGRLDETVASLDAAIGEALSGITVQQRTAAIVGSVTKKLAGAVAMARGMVPPATAGALSAGLAEHAGRYSMQSERRVHDVVIREKGESGDAAEFVPASPDGGPAGEFGDNVELF
ncbi:MAG TPA: methyl-accepting chemotaxis protein [Geobacteraceae bacterium]